MDNVFNLNVSDVTKSVLDMKDEMGKLCGKCVTWIREMPDWHELALSLLHNVDVKIDSIPNFEIQNKLDRMGRFIDKHCQPLKELSKWIDSNGDGHWLKQLMIGLMKLPMRAIRNILRALCQIVSALAYSAVHPLKALNNAARLLVDFIHELRKPETWTKMGVGVLGASIGQALVTVQPISLIGVGIGAAMALGGITVGMLQAGFNAEEGMVLVALKDALINQLKDLPESFLTGLLTGLMVGGIQRGVGELQVRANMPTTHEEVIAWSNRYATAHDFSLPENVYSSPWRNNMIMFWNDPIHFQSTGLFADTVSFQTRSLSVNPALLHHADIFQNFAISRAASPAVTAAMMAQKDIV